MATSIDSAIAATLANERRRRAESFADGYMPPEKLVVDPSLHFHAEADDRPRPGLLRGPALEALERQLGPPGDDPPRLRQPGRRLRLRLQHDDPDRGRGGRLLRPRQPLLRRLRRPGRQVDARAPLDERRHQRGRHLPPGRPLDRHQPPDGRRRLRAGLLRGQAVRLGLQRDPPARARRGRARRLHPAGPRRLRRADLLPADEAGRRGQGARGRRRRLGPALAPGRADDARAALADRRGGARPGAPPRPGRALRRRARSRGRCGR